MSNDLYFESLKNIKDLDGNYLYPNIQNYSVKDNIFSFNDIQLDLNNIALNMLDPIIFTFEKNDAFIILKNILINTKDPGFIDKEVQYMLYLEDLKNIDDNQKTYITNYLNNYYTKKNIKEKYAFDELNEELEKRTIPITNAYIEEEIYNNPASTYIRDFESNHYQKNSNVLQYQGPILIRTDKSLMPNDYESDSFKEAGFINTIVIISLTIVLGIIIGLILH